ncbi:DUF1015 family protein [uncultured Victivallis sp.]|uniref:DUF1015 domain-containing protein n=1 Tax=uncultured Victivallis sp. TaxID=354118 RepID=UPI0025E013E9|nr:DUF1015 family protein [uncultured Victivallis sp.]
MAQLLPFHGLLPSVERAAAVAAVPYDVVNSREAAELAKGNPWSFLHVSRPEIDLEPGIDLHDERVYAQAAAAFQRFCREVPLTLDKGEHLYVYRLVMNGRAQTGVLGAASAEEYRSGVIKKHEKTRQDKEDDRTRHVMELRSHTGPAFFTYRDQKEIDALIDEETAREPLFDFTAPDGVRHTLWRLDEEVSRKLSKLFADLVPVFYIADGHHRSAAAARTAAECAPKNPNHTGKEDYNYFLTVAFPATQLRILPYNRVVRSLNGNSPAGFLTLVGEKFQITPTEDGEVEHSGEFKFYMAHEWYLARPKFDIASLGVIERLDVSILQDNILAPILGIEDPRTSREIDFIGGIRGIGELEKLVNSGRYAIAFSMYPTTVEQLMAIADAGAIMPPKSTWFEPKLRDGLVCHNF